MVSRRVSTAWSTTVGCVLDRVHMHAAWLVFKSLQNGAYVITADGVPVSLLSQSVNCAV